MLRCLTLPPVLVLAVCCAAAYSAVPDPQIMTDHPVYRGELACSTLDRNIADAHRIFKDRYGHEPASDTEKLVALWVWKCEHGIHSADNRVYVGPDHMEAARDGDAKGWMDNRDCQMNQFSFGFCLCYSRVPWSCAVAGPCCYSGG